VEQDLDGFGIGGHDDEFADTSVEGLESNIEERAVRREKVRGAVED